MRDGGLRQRGETETKKGGAVSVPISVSFCSILLTPGFHPGYDRAKQKGERCKEKGESVVCLLLTKPDHRRFVHYGYTSCSLRPTLKRRAQHTKPGKPGSQGASAPFTT